MKIAVVVSTYNSPKSLRHCLFGLLAQSQPPDQVVIADDGSTDETRKVIQSPEFEALGIEHVWHEDRGWRKNVILNLALARVSCEYVVFLDGDCIARRDFVERHSQLSRPGYYLSGGRLHISATIYDQFTPDDILRNRVFQVEFLERHAKWLGRFKYRLHPGRWRPVLDLLTYRYAVFHGSNASAWTRDILRVNGFNESCSYGSDDREFGARLHNAGVKSRWLKYSLCQLHLAHPGSADAAQLRQNRARLRRTFSSGLIRTDPGIDTALPRAEKERCLSSVKRQRANPREVECGR